MASTSRRALIVAAVIAILTHTDPSPVFAVSVKDILQEIIPRQPKAHRPRPSAPRPPLPQPKPDAPKPDAPKPDASKPDASKDGAEAADAKAPPPLPPEAPAEKSGEAPPPLPEADPRGPDTPPPAAAAPEAPAVPTPDAKPPAAKEPAAEAPPALSVGPIVEPTPPHVEETAPALPAAPGPSGALGPTITPAPPTPAPAAPPETAIVAPAPAEPPASAEPPRIVPTAEELAACKAGMAALGIVSEAQPPLFEGECGAADPYRVTALSGGAVTVEPAATVDCAVASALARWVDEDIQPAAKSAYGAPLTRLSIAGSYVCRTRNHVPGARMSEHSFMNAVDIGGFTIAGRTITVLDGEARTGADDAFIEAVRKAACARFTTVLGPGSDAEHDNHLHLDMIRRGRNGDGRLCE